MWHNGIVCFCVRQVARKARIACVGHAGKPFAQAVVSVWRQTADYLDTHLQCITRCVTRLRVSPRSTSSHSVRCLGVPEGHGWIQIRFEATPGLVRVHILALIPALHMMETAHGH